MMEVTTYEDRSQPLIECTAVQKHYPDFALDVTLTVPENTIVGLVGHSASVRKGTDWGGSGGYRISGGVYTPGCQKDPGGFLQRL